MKLKSTIVSILALGLLAGSAVGASAQDDARPTFFTWTYGDGEGQFEPGTVDETQDSMALRGFVQTDPIVADDERASGLLTLAFSADGWGDGNLNAPEIIEVYSESQRLVNDGGVWSGSGTSVSFVPAGDGAEPSGAAMATLTGEAGYDGLTLVLLRVPSEDGGTGFILPSVPPAPELPAQ